MGFCSFPFRFNPPGSPLLPPENNRAGGLQLGRGQGGRGGKPSHTRTDAPYNLLAPSCFFPPHSFRNRALASYRKTSRGQAGSARLPFESWQSSQAGPSPRPPPLYQRGAGGGGWANERPSWDVRSISWGNCVCFPCNYWPWDNACVLGVVSGPLYSQGRGLSAGSQRGRTQN